MKLEEFNSITKDVRADFLAKLESSNRIKERIKDFSDSDGKLTLEDAISYAFLESMHISMDYTERLLAELFVKED